MLFVLSGPWGIGKSETIRYLSDNYEFQTLIPWSTKISSEILRGTKYNLLLNSHDEYRGYSQNDLRNLSKFFSCPYFNNAEEENNNGKLEIGFWCQPFKNSGDYQVLGYRMEEIIGASNQNAVVIEADTTVAKQLKVASEQGVIGRVVNIFLNYETEESFKRRLDLEKTYNGYERRMKKVHREKEIEFYNLNKGLFDYCITSDDVPSLIQDVVGIVMNFIRETPNMLHKRPGILSDRDIQLSLVSKDITCSINQRHQSAINRYLKSVIYKDGFLDYNAIRSSSIDLYLSPECRVLRNIQTRQLDLILGGDVKLTDLLDQNKVTDVIDMNVPENFERIFQMVSDSRTATFHDLFEEKEITLQDGLLLNPQDIVLCSSLEDISIGPNIFAFITAKYSFSQIGLSVTLSQNILQPCHSGKVMLQLKNNLPYPIVIYPYMQIAQCVFFRTVSNSLLCRHHYEDFSSPRYDSSIAFKELSKEVVKSKNWYDINRKKHAEAKADKEIKITQERRAKWQLRISVIAIVVGLLSPIVNILIKILFP